MWLCCQSASKLGNIHPKVVSFSLHLRHFFTSYIRSPASRWPECIYMDFSILLTIGFLCPVFRIVHVNTKSQFQKLGISLIPFMRNLIFLPEEKRTASMRRTSNTGGSIIADTTWTKWRFSKAKTAAATRQNKLICLVVPAASCWHLTELCLQEAHSSDWSLSHIRFIFSVR